MTEDILEQLVDDWFKRKPSTFTKHNVKYRPDLSKITPNQKKLYSVNSDIDVIAVTLNQSQLEVSVVSCKSWQGGFDIAKYYNWLSDETKYSEIVSGRNIWKSFRELTNDTWAEAFREKIYQETNTKNFTYYIAVTKLLNPYMEERFVKCETFLNKLKGNDNNVKVEIKFLTLDFLVKEIFKESKNTAIEATDIGRFIQLLKAADLKLENIT